jgi:hypothetical protein
MRDDTDNIIRIGNTETRRLEGSHVVETRYRGFVSAKDGLELVAKIRELMNETPRIDWLIVLEPGYDMEILPKASVEEVVATFKVRGNRIAAVIPGTAKRNSAKLLALITGAGATVLFCETREEALAHLRRAR